jgi:hypothetical protein
MWVLNRTYLTNAFFQNTKNSVNDGAIGRAYLSSIPMNGLITTGKFGCLVSDP